MAALAILKNKMTGRNHNTTMTRNEICFFTGAAGLSNFNLVFIEIRISSEHKGLGSLQNVNCEEGSGPAMLSCRCRHMYWRDKHNSASAARP